MQAAYFYERLAETPKTIAQLARGAAAEQWRWRPAPDSWSALELMAHMADEEREDFRAHLDAVLAEPQQPWARIDPAGWVAGRGYNGRDPAATLAAFLDARAESLGWLKGLRDPDWSRAIQTPWGSLRAGDILTSWAAHDLHAVRQLTELHYAWLATCAAPFGLEYAGDW